MQPATLSDIYSRMVIRRPLLILLMGLLLPSLLSGCADSTVREATAPTAPPSDNTVKPFKHNGLDPLDDLRDDSLSADYQRYHAHFYQVLLAKIASFSGDYSLAAYHFYTTAESTQNTDLAKEATIMALHAGESELALRSARLWLQLEPDSVQARQALIASLVRSGKLDDAIAYIDDLLSQQGQLSDTHLSMLSKLLQNREQSTETLQRMQQLVDKYPQELELRFVYVRLLLAERNWAAAERQLSILIKRDPLFHAEAVPLLIRILNQQDSQPRSLRVLEDLLKRFPNQQEWRDLYAKQLVQAERVPDAIEQFKLLLKAEADNIELVYTLGLLYLEQKKPKLAKRYLKRMLKEAQLEKERNAARFFLGQAEEQDKNRQAALDWYQKVGDGPQYFSSNIQIVLIYIRYEDWDAALAHLRSVQGTNAEESLALLKIEAEVLIELDQYDAAFALYERGLGIEPDNLDFLYMHAMMAEKLDKLALSEQSFRRVISLEPNNVEALNALGYTLADRTERYDEAYELIKKAYEQRPDAHHILDSMGWVLYRLERYEEAIIFLRQALDKQADPEIAAHLGEVLWVSGDQAAARDVWKQGQQLDPEHAILQKTLHRFVPDGL